MELLIVSLVLGLIIIIYIVCVRNSLVVLKNRVEDQASQIDIQLKRRFDLIPNLVEVVKGYMKHENKTLEDVISARNNYLTAHNKDEIIKYNEELTASLNKLLIVAENYPDLKANQSFAELQNELVQTEDKIAYARQFYNDTVLKLNSKIDVFPSNIVAKVFSIKKEKYIKITMEEKQNVNIEF